jgi:D-3-phosphoglycerate dehydrogenase / 2-oxoglutarate reductase
VRVLVTDHPWPDTEIERSICTAAGHELICGPIAALPQADIERLVAAHLPHAIMCCWATVSGKAIELPPDLRVVARLGVGLDNIAMSAATARGAWVTNVPDYCVEEVSDHVIAMLLAHWRGIVHFDREAKQLRWEPASARLARTRNMTVGIVGYGRIGSLTARKISQGFAARVLASSPTLLATRRPGDEVAPGVVVATLDDIRRDADAIVLHLPLNAMSRHLIDDAFLNGCRRKPLLVNVSRGGLVDNEALIRALDSGLLSGAALDVVEGEPTPPKSIVGRPDIVVTPHVAFSSAASLEELRRRCAEDVVRILRGERPLHPCNEPEVS